MNSNEYFKIAKVLPWHEPFWQTLVTAWQQNRLPQAWLLSGPVGMGKSLLAQRLVESLLCEQAQPDGQACGHCKSCHLIQVGHHPDWFRVQPVEEGKSISVEQIRELIGFCALTSQYGRYQIVVINPAEAMNRNASNSLLKLLEEPPAKTLLILISHQPMLLLATLRSRCQQLDFSRLKGGAAWLLERLPKHFDIPLLLKLTQQAPLAALTLANSEGLQKRRQLFESLLQLCSGRQNPIEVAERWNQLEDSPQVLRWLLSWTMDLIRGAMTGSAWLVNQDEQAALAKLAKQINLHQLFKLLDLQNETYSLIIKTTTQVKPQGLLEAIAITWAQVSGRASL